MRQEQHVNIKKTEEAAKEGEEKNKKEENSTNPPEGVEAGELRCRVGVALHRPSEFVIFETSQTSAGALINE